MLFQYQRSYKTLFFKKNSLYEYILFCFTYLPKIKIIIKNKTYEKIFIFSSKGLGWNIPLKQRSQHIAEILSQKNNLIFYAINKDLEIDKKIKYFKKENENLFLINFENEKINNAFINLLIKYSKKPIYYEFIQTDFRNTYKYIKTLIDKKIKIIYHYMDRISEEIIPNIPKHVYDRHIKILKNKKIFIIATADELISEVKKYRNTNYLLSCNAVSIQDWKPTKKIPKDIKNIINQKKIIIGYYGAMAKWLDYKLLKEIITNKKNINFVFIGSNYDDSLFESKITKINNVFYLGPKPYLELKEYSKFFDICILPFKVNKTTAAVSPVKLFEYMAQKKPIISTNLKECKKYKGCLISNNPKDFIKKIDEGINKLKDTNYLNNLYDTAKKNTWEKRVDEIINFLKTNER